MEIEDTLAPESTMGSSAPQLPPGSEEDAGRSFSPGGAVGKKLGDTGTRRCQGELRTAPMSRWVVFFLYCCYCLMAGPAFLNWTTISDMLYTADAYVWECAPGIIGTPLPKPEEPKCAAQEIAVNNLFSVASSACLVFAMLGGVALDFAGPKLGALSGIGCLILGWTLLAFSGETFRAYIPAMIFIGAGVDMAFLPCLCGANLFPGFVATIIALYGACRSLSFVSGLVLRGIFFNVPGATLRGSLLGYVCLGLGFCLCVALFVIPWKAWPPLETETEGCAGSAKKAGDTAREENERTLQLKCTGRRKGKRSRGDLQGQRVSCTRDCKGASPGQKIIDAESPLLHKNGETASTGADTCGSPADAMLLLQREVEEGEAGGGMTGLAPACVEDPLPKPRRVAEETEIFKDEKIAHPGATSKRFIFLSNSFARDLLSPAFLPVMPYFVFALIDILFFMPSARRLIPDAYAVNQIVTVCGFASCIVLGCLADRIGIVYVMIICNSAGLLSWVLLRIPGIPCFTAFQYVASILLTLQMSFMVSQIYCYVTYMFSPENVGKLIGLLCSTGGIISLVTSPMRSYAVNHSFVPMVVLCLVLAAVNEGVLVFMLCWQRRMKRVKQSHVVLKERTDEEDVTV